MTEIATLPTYETQLADCRRAVHDLGATALVVCGTNSDSYFAANALLYGSVEIVQTQTAVLDRLACATEHIAGVVPLETRKDGEAVVSDGESLTVLEAMKDHEETLTTIATITGNRGVNPTKLAIIGQTQVAAAAKNDTIPTPSRSHRTRAIITARSSHRSPHSFMR